MLSEEALLAVAVDLQAALVRSRDYLHRCWRCPRRESARTPPLHVALSYDSRDDGAPLHVAAVPSLLDDDTGEAMLAIQLDAKTVTKSLEAYLTRLGAHAETQVGTLLHFNRVVRHAARSAEQTNTTTAALVVSRRLLAAVTPLIPTHGAREGILCLTALLLPGSADVWNVLRADLVRAAASAYCVDTSSTTDRWITLWLVTSLVLSHHVKLQEVWQLRAWLVTFACREGLLVSPSTYAEEEGVDAGGQARLRPALFLDDPVFFYAVAQHPMNYNAWQYRRTGWQACVVVAGTAVTEESGRRLAVRRARLCQSADDTRRESERVMAFVDTHNGDCSATSYLLFLLHTLAAAVDASDVYEGVAVHRQALQDQWRTLFSFTHRAIRSHAETGHESIWMLRLGLIQAASDGQRLHGGWTVKDELDWVSVFVDGVAAHAVAEEVRSAPLLEPAPGATPQQVWSSALTGSPACASFFAARYGLQLIALLRRRGWA